MSENNMAVSLGGLIAIGLFLNPVSTTTIITIGTSAAIGTIGIGLICSGVNMIRG